MPDAYDTHRQSTATWVTTGQRRFSTYPPSISVTSPATPGFPEPQTQMQMQFRGGQLEGGDGDVDGGGGFPPPLGYGDHQAAAEAVVGGYDGGFGQNQGLDFEDEDPDVDENFTIDPATNGMPTPNVPRSVPLPVTAEMSQRGFVPPSPLGPMYTGAPGSDSHAMDSPAEFARRPNELLSASRLRLQGSGKDGLGGSGGARRRFRAFARAIGRVLAMASPMRIVNAVRRRRKPARRTSPGKFPTDFEFRDPTPAPASVRASMSAGAGTSGRNTFGANASARRNQEEEEEEEREERERRELDLERGLEAGSGGVGREQAVTMIGGLDENEARRTMGGVNGDLEREGDEALEMPGAMHMQMPTPMIVTPPGSVERQTSANGPPAHPISNERSHSHSHRSNRTQGDTGETAVHDSGLGGLHNERGRSRERAHSHRHSGSLHSRSPQSPSSPVRPTQPPPSIRKARSLSTRSTRTYSGSSDAHSIGTHSSSLIVHLRSAVAAIRKLYHLPWVASPPHRLTADFVPAFSSARSKYRAGRRHGVSGVPAADVAAARALADMAEGESWYRLSPQQMAQRREKRERARAERAAMRRSYGTGTTRSQSRRSSDYYHRLADSAAAATLELGGASSPRRPQPAYVSPTQAAAQVQSPMFGGGVQYVPMPNGMGGQQMYMISPAGPAGTLPLPVTSPHGSPGSNRGERDGRVHRRNTMSPTRRLSILSGRGRRHNHGHQHSSSHGFSHFLPQTGGGAAGTSSQPVFIVHTTYPPPPSGASPIMGNGGGNNSPALPPNYVHPYPYPYVQGQQPVMWPPGLAPNTQTQGQSQAQGPSQQAT